MRFGIGRVALAAYMLYLMTVDRLTPKQGGRPDPRVRGNRIWQLVYQHQRPSTRSDQIRDHCMMYDVDMYE